jgi:tetratricopeptide (TPR) repeat protein
VRFALRNKTAREVSSLRINAEGSDYLLLESGKYDQVRHVLPIRHRSLNLRYLRTLALFGSSIDSLISWFKYNGDPILHPNPPPQVIDPLRTAIAEFDSLLTPNGARPVVSPEGVGWYAYYSRARAKQMFIEARGVSTGDEIRELRDIYRQLITSATANHDIVALTRAFIEWGGFALQLSDSTYRSPLAHQLYDQANTLLSKDSLPLELRAQLYMRLGSLCANSENALPASCTLDSYDRALKLYRQLGSYSGEAAVHRSLGDVYALQPLIEAHTRAMAEYALALQLGKQSPDISVGVQTEYAWKYLNSVYNYYQGDIPPSRAGRVYDYIVQNTTAIPGERPRLRGAGDFVLQAALIELKQAACEQQTASNLSCWDDVLSRTDALLTGFIGLDDTWIAPLSAYRARAKWELSAHSGYVDRVAIQELIAAIASNNRAGGIPSALRSITKLYSRMTSTLGDSIADAAIMERVRLECLTTGKSYVLPEADSLATQLFIELPNGRKKEPVPCARTSFVRAFRPVSYSMPEWSRQPLFSNPAIPAPQESTRP